MDAIEQLKADLRNGTLDPQRLLELLTTVQHLYAAAQRTIADLQRRIAQQAQRIAELEQKSGPAAGAPSPTPAKIDQPFSMRAEEKRQEKRGKHQHKLCKKKRRGRLSSHDKLKLAVRTVACFPAGVPHAQCWLSHTRPVWHLENGRAVVVAYDIYRGPSNQYGQIPNVLGRSEFGLEFALELAYFVYGMGLSFDKACQLLGFLQNLPLNKTQADKLLRQLACSWEHEFDVLCTLLANSCVVNADETRWSINSVWALLSEQARVLLFGVHKDGATLEQILDPRTFQGLVISDDAAVYAKFSEGQKCWAHLLRKAIKLTLQAPQDAEYRAFTDQLLEIYHQACRVKSDGRLSDAGRERKVLELDEEIIKLCFASLPMDTEALEGLQKDYRLLAKEVFRLMMNKQLFQFVSTQAATQPNGQSKPASGTNNEAERTLRAAAEARKTGRTNKTMAGARRQTIVASVLESLRVYLPQFTMMSVMAELRRWQEAGQSCFSAWMSELGLQVKSEGVLDKLMPVPDG